MDAPAYRMNDMQVENLKEIATWVSAGERNGVPPDTEAYIECVRQRASR